MYQEDLRFVCKRVNEQLYNQCDLRAVYDYFLLLDDIL